MTFRFINDQDPNYSILEEIGKGAHGNVLKVERKPDYDAGLYSKASFVPGTQ
jgi:hypothetical protein